MRKHRLTIIALLLSAVLCGSSVQAAAPSKYDIITDARARAVNSALEQSMQYYRRETATISTYNATQLNALIEENKHLEVIAERDQCQFTPDIENRARLVHIPPFEYAWADMLINGVCVKQDINLGLSYLESAMQHAYAPALMRLSRFYETGFIVHENKDLAMAYMKTAAQLGSSIARLNWADMLVRGFGGPRQYEEAYRWLYSTHFSDLYLQEKSNYLQAELEKRMPPNVTARARSYAAAFN
ncbi:MAG: sel1 repeat family protein [Proteobacteria bacterium]|uniref:Sel1 repeat family protein n=1 Tax=Candidatus Avisuccinivibrio stercorigallinarum TaxID=2840704 RepID=A0A9D9GN92_9GAMM|nr:sel1 repeat family protein [Candidatus Avisuccinivibrio stercorigallinarum]